MHVYKLKERLISEMGTMKGHLGVKWDMSTPSPVTSLKGQKCHIGVVCDLYELLILAFLHG